MHASRHSSVSSAPYELSLGDLLPRLLQTQKKRVTTSIPPPKLVVLEPKFTLFNLFQLSIITHLTQIESVLTLSRESKRLAWLGDSLLACYASEYLDKVYPKDNAQQLHDKRGKYTENSSQSQFLREATNILDSIPHQHLSQHSIGTMFEALLALCYHVKGESAARDCTMKYITWINNTEEKHSLNLSSLHVKMEVWKDGKQLFASFNDNIEDDPRKLPLNSEKNLSSDLSALLSSHLNLNAIVSLVPVTPTLPTNALSASPSPTLSSSPLPLLPALQSVPRTIKAIPHTAEVITLQYTSGSGAKYPASFYMCCGLPSPAKSCTRAPGKIHQGTLVISTSRKTPGGEPPLGSENDHRFRPREPQWSCCRSLASAPGCSDE